MRAVIPGFARLALMLARVPLSLVQLRPAQYQSRHLYGLQPLAPITWPVNCLAGLRDVLPKGRIST